MNLQGATILITGGRRVGRELAFALARRRAQVALTYKSSRETIEETVAEVERLGGRGLAVEADLAQPEQASAAVARTVERFGRLDALINMASIYRRTPYEKLAPADYDELIAANLTAPYHSAVFASKAMLAQEPGSNGIKGKIVNLGDWTIDRPRTGYLPYTVAKGGLKTMTLALAKELAPHVLVNMIQPATIDPAPDFTEADLDAIRAATPLHRIGTPDDANNLILYLLEGTDFVTATCIRVDGGRFLGVDDETT